MSSVRAQPTFRLLASTDDVGLSSKDESGDQLTGTVPRRDLGQAIAHVKVFTIRTGSHVGVAQGVCSCRRLPAELAPEQVA